MQPPFFSIIVTSYNNGSLISEAILSALTQSFAEFEIIIADNCSEDDSWDVICSFNDPRIRRFRHPRNIGMYPNLNFSVSKSCGSYLKFLNSDDVLHPQCLEILRVAIASRREYALGHPIHVNHGLLCDREANSEWKNSDLTFDDKCEEVEFAAGGLPNCCVHREHFISVGVFGHPAINKDFSRDILAFGLSAIGVKKIYIPHQLALERIHGNQSRHAMKPAKRFQLEEVLFVYSESGRLDSATGKAELNALLFRHFLSSLKYLFLYRDAGYLAFVIIFALRNPLITLSFAN